MNAATPEPPPANPSSTKATIAFIGVFIGIIVAASFFSSRLPPQYRATDG